MSINKKYHTGPMRNGITSAIRNRDAVSMERFSGLGLDCVLKRFMGAANDSFNECFDCGRKIEHCRCH